MTICCKDSELGKLEFTLSQIVLSHCPAQHLLKFRVFLFREYVDDAVQKQHDVRRRSLRAHHS